MQAITSVKSSRDGDESVFQSSKRAHFSGQKELDTAIVEQVQGICSSLRKSRVSDMEEAIEALVKTAFELREHICHQLLIPKLFDRIDDQITCNVRGHLLKYDQRTHRITFIVLDRLIDFDSHIVTCSGKQNKRQAQLIHDYVVTNKACFCGEAQHCKSDIYKRPAESGVDRALQFTKTGDVFIHFNRKKQRDELIGDGTYKTVVKAMNLATGQFFASASFKKEDDPEIGFLEKFQGVEGIVQMHHSASYEGKDGSNKKRVILELYNEGDLLDKMHKMGVTETSWGALEKKQIAQDLIQILAFLHNQGCAHRDVKPENIFLSRKHAQDVLRAVLGDLGFIWDKDNKDNPKMRGTLDWVSPELAKYRLKLLLLRSSKQPPITLEEMQKGDVWALGLTLSFLFEPFECPWMRIKEGKDKEVLQMIIDTDERPEPSDPHSPIHLAWQMTRKDPKDRISAQKALEELPLLSWGGKKGG